MQNSSSCHYTRAPSPSLSCCVVQTPKTPAMQQESLWLVDLGLIFVVEEIDVKKRERKKDAEEELTGEEDKRTQKDECDGVVVRERRQGKMKATLKKRLTWRKICSLREATFPPGLCCARESMHLSDELYVAAQNKSYSRLFRGHYYDGC
jgi:hypothetical protein